MAGEPAASASGATIVSALHRVAWKFPERIAVGSEGATLGYGELLTRSRRLTAALRGGSAATVAILEPGGTDLGVAVAAVLESGRAYLPLASSLPAARARTLLDELGIETVVTAAGRAREAAALGREIVLVGEERDEHESGLEPAAPARADSPAYVIATSGSTGVPSLVVRTHANVLNNIRNYSQATRIEPGDRLATVLNFGAGAAASDIFGALLNGASLWPFDLRQRGLAALLEWIESNEITVFHAVPTLFRRLARLAVDSGRLLRSLRLVRLSGEASTRNDLELVARVAPSAELMTGLSFSELGLVRAFVAKPEGFPAAEPILPAGFAIDGIESIVVDETGRAAPPGVAGRIAVRSPFLAARWSGGEARALPIAGGYYFCGDLGRLDADGCLTVLGRIDDQIKVRGLRVDPAEVEATLRAHPRVSECAVRGVSDATGEKRLLAWVVSGVGSADGALEPELRKFLLQRLPPHMLPVRFTILPELPTLPGGKVDVQALPLASDPQPAPGVEAANALEAEIARIFAQALPRAPRSLDDDFFDLGGDSLAAVEVTAALTTFCGGEELPPSALLEGPTVRQLAELVSRHLRESPGERSFVTIPTVQRGALERCALYVVASGRGFLDPRELNFVGLRNLARQLGAERPVFTFSWQGGRGGEAIRLGLEELAAAFVASLRNLQPEGPYALAGYSSGGRVAYEMACQLRAEGQAISLLALLDSYGPGFPKRMAWREPRRWRALLRRVQRILGRLARQNPRLSLTQVVARYRDWRDAAERDAIDLAPHQPAPYSGVVDLLRAEERRVDLPFDYGDPECGWGPYCVGGLRIAPIPAEHDFLLQEPGLSAVAAVLRARLRETESARGEAAAPESLCV